MKYEQVFNGDWIEPLSQRGHFIRCCDCGLVHRFNFRVRTGKVQFQPFTDQPRTRQYRKSRKGKSLKCVPRRRKMAR